MARLLLLSEGFNGRTYELKVDKTTVGRVSDNAFEIPEASVSSHHAEILLRGNDIVIRDLSSTNGQWQIDRSDCPGAQAKGQGRLGQSNRPGNSAAPARTGAPYSTYPSTGRCCRI